MLKLLKLKFKGIGRFVEEQEIDFTTLGKFVQLSGKNNNTKGSSGAGKSTVFMAFDYLLGVNNRPSTVLKCRFSDEGIWVEGIFEYNGLPLRITRGKKLEIELDGEITKGSSSKSEEKLDLILGMDRELIRKMVHKRQKEGGFFLQMTPAEVNSFLTTALGHDKSKKDLEAVDKELKKVTDSKTSLEKDLSAAKSGLKATQDAFLSIGNAPVKEVDQELILKLKKTYDASDGLLKATETRHRFEIEELEEHRPKLQPSPYDRSKLDLYEAEANLNRTSQARIQQAENTRVTSARNEYSKLLKEVSVLREAVKTGEAAWPKIEEIIAQLKVIKDGNCYTCGQRWQDKEKEDKLRMDALRYRGEYQKGNQAKEQLVTLEIKLQHLETDAQPRALPEIEDLTKKLNEIAPLIQEEKEKEKLHNATVTSRASEAQKAFSEKSVVLKTRHAQEILPIQNQCKLDNTVLQNAITKLKMYEDARTRYESTIASLKTQEKTYEEKVADLSGKVSLLCTDLELTEELHRALKSHLSCSFDEALETISSNATEIIRHIPNMANATIQLEGLKETGSGKVKEEVNAVLHMDGESNVDLRSLCGGERTSTDLAIDLAVIDFLESTANKGIDIFILDEPFNGLDTVCIEEALEVLRNSKSNKRLVIVDHNPEVQEMVEDKLVVIRDGSTSRIGTE